MALPGGFEEVDPRPSRDENIWEDDTELILLRIPSEVDAAALDGKVLRCGKSIVNGKRSYEIREGDISTVSHMTNAFQATKQDAIFQLGKPFTKVFDLVLSEDAIINDKEKPAKMIIPYTSVSQKQNLKVRFFPIGGGSFAESNNSQLGKPDGQRTSKKRKKSKA